MVLPCAGGSSICIICELNFALPATSTVWMISGRTYVFIWWDSPKSYLPWERANFGGCNDTKRQNILWQENTSTIDGLTHWPLVVRCGDIDLGQHWVRLVAWWHVPSHYLNQCWPKINDIHPSVISRKMHKICWQKWSFEIKFLMIFLHMPTDNGLIHKRRNSICLHTGMGHVAIAEMSRLPWIFPGAPIWFQWGSRKCPG